jgi:hypothetical protein
MQWIGFTVERDGSIKEHLPESEQMADKAQRRQLFFSLFNYYMPKELRFSKSEYTSVPHIKAAFDQKIEMELKQIAPAKKGDFHFDLISTKLIHNYLQSTPQVVVGVPRSSVASLIQLISVSGRFSLMMDLEDMFLTLVFERIKKVNRDKKVLMHKNEIIMYDTRPDISPTLVLPFYTALKQESFFDSPEVTGRLEKAKACLRRGEIRQIFLVFPKSSSFKKHLEVKFADRVALGEDEYQVKMVPYSFSFCIKKEKRRLCGNRYFLRK